MAGGLAQRMGLGEKACIMLYDKPLISYVIEALSGSGKIDGIHAAVTKATPKTKQFLLDNYPEIDVIDTDKGNYVQDMVHAVRSLNTKEPVMIVMCDLPLLEPAIIDDIISVYEQHEEPALSTYVPIAVCKRSGLRPDTVFHKNGKLIVPTGINILDAEDIDHEQPDYNYILEDGRLAMNVNTPEDLELCRQIMKEKGKGTSGENSGSPVPAERRTDPKTFQHLQALFSGQDMTVRKTKPFFYFDLFRTISDQDERSSAVI